MDSDERRARFAELHARAELFLLPNPWDVGSARLLASMGFDALATTSQGFAWSLGRLDQEVSRDELVAHVRELSAAIDLPLNVDSERCYPDEPGGVAETVALLAEAGGAGFSVEDYDPVTGKIDGVDVASERVAVAAEANRSLSTPMMLTGRAENHIHGVDDLDDTIARLLAYRDAGADAVYAPGLKTIEQIADVVATLRCPATRRERQQAPWREGGPLLSTLGARPQPIARRTVLLGAADTRLRRTRRGRQPGERLVTRWRCRAGRAPSSNFAAPR